MKTRTFGSDGCHEKHVFADKVSLFRFQMASTEWHSRHECSGSCVGLGATVVMWGRSAAARVIFKILNDNCLNLITPKDILPVRPPPPEVVRIGTSTSSTTTSKIEAKLTDIKSDASVWLMLPPPFQS